MQVRKPDRVHALTQQLARRLVKKGGVALQKDRRRLLGERAVEVDGEAVVPAHELFLLDLADGIQQLLRPSHGKGRDDDAAAAVKRALDVPRQRGDGVAGALVQPSAVGGLYNEHVRRVHGLRVAQDGLAGVADVAGKDDLFLNAVLRQPQLHARRAEQMPHVRKPQTHALRRPYRFAVGARMQQRQRGGGIVGGVERLNGGLTRALGFARLPLRVGHLDVGGVHEHDAAQRVGGFRGVNFAVEAVLAELGQQPRVVDVCVREEHRVDLARRNGQRCVFKHVHALFHTVIDKKIPPAGLQQRAAPGDLVRCAEEGEFHTIDPRLMWCFSIISPEQSVCK